MKTTQQLEDLKKQWIQDPIWDIEETEDFESHKLELLMFRKEHERQSEEDYKAELLKYASKRGIPSTNIQFIEYLRGLEIQVELLQAEIDKLKESRI